MLPKSSLPKGTKIPDHIAMILDGNRRWARSNGLKPWDGHNAGYKAILKVAKAARDLGVHTFTIWAFSTENWDRPKEEIVKIFELLEKGLAKFSREAHKDKVRLVHLGRKDRFPKYLSNRIAKLEKETAKYDKYILNLALDYGGRDELVRAVKKIIADNIDSEDLTEEKFAGYLDTSGQPYPYPDLFIRTSGEQRTSGLLPWQMTYTEFYWEDCHLPDFTKEHLTKAILDYSRRRRRFGGDDVVEHLSFKPELTAKLELAWWRLSKIPYGTRLRDFAVSYLKEQYGMSKSLAKEGAKHLIEAVKNGDEGEWERAKLHLKRFYKLVKKQLKLAFEPEIVTSLKLDFWKGIGETRTNKTVGDIEEVATNLLAEEYRISTLQAAKAAHLRVLAETEKAKALAGEGEAHWKQASNYLQKYYKALKERVA
jgi:undecaprenyl diphosphate synthase